jgi:hypothetical protein
LAELFFPDYTFLYCLTELIIADYTLLHCLGELIIPNYMKITSLAKHFKADEDFFLFGRLQL